MTCPVCAGAEIRHKLRKQGIEVVQCGACGLAFWTPRAPFDPAQIYDGAYFACESAAHGYDDYAALEPALRATFRRRVARLRLAAGARVLDAGAAYGYAGSEAERAGLRVAAVELSREAAAHAAMLLPGHVARASADCLPFESASFDAVMLWDVLEHLPDPHRAVAELARCLRQGGRLALTTGNVDSLVARLSGRRWHLYTLPEHLFFHSPESLRRLLGAHGLRIEQMRAEGAWFPIGYLVERLRKSLLGTASPRPVRFPGARLVLPVNLFDVLTVVAVRVP